MYGFLATKCTPPDKLSLRKSHFGFPNSGDRVILFGVLRLKVTQMGPPMIEIVPQHRLLDSHSSHISWTLDTKTSRLNPLTRPITISVSSSLCSLLVQSNIIILILTLPAMNTYRLGVDTEVPATRYPLMSLLPTHDLMQATDSKETIKLGAMAAIFSSRVTNLRQHLQRQSHPVLHSLNLSPPVVLKPSPMTRMALTTLLDHYLKPHKQPRPTYIALHPLMMRVLGLSKTLGYLDTGVNPTL